MPTSVLVPPMSNEIRSGNPARAPAVAAPATPAAGPDANSRTGKRSATAAGTTPPLLWTTSTGAAIPAASSRRRSSRKCSRIRGIAYALSTAVLVRSHSPYSREISVDSEPPISGHASPTRAPISSSWALLTKLLISATASTSAPALTSSRTTPATSSRSSGVSTCPRASTRSCTSQRSSRATSGLGFWKNRLNTSSPRSLRASSRTSRNPAVVTSPTRAPFRSTSVFVARVVP